MKRPAPSGEETDITMANGGSARGPRRNVTVPSSTSKSPASNLRLSFRQQALEQANEDASKRLNQCQTNDETFLVAAEHRRLYGEIDKLYRVEGGEVVTMGNDDFFQLGVKQSDDDECEFDYIPTLVRNIPLGDIIQVAGGGLHSGAVTIDGKAYTWGNSDKGNLGRDVDEGFEGSIKQVTEGFAPEDKSMINSLSCGNSHTLFLTMRGKVYASGMFKDGDSGEFQVVPRSATKCKGQINYPVHVKMPNGIRAKEVVSGGDFAAIIDERGTLYTFGMGVNGQLARSDTMGATLLDNGMYDLSKQNFLGQEYETTKKNAKGEEETDSAYRYFQDKIVKEFLTPHPVSWSTIGRKVVLSFACGELHMVVAAREGSSFESQVYVAGSGGYGQVGRQDTKLELHKLTELEALRGQQIVKVAAGQYHSLALNIAGNAVFSWGRKDKGELGRSVGEVPPPPASYEYEPKQVEFPSSVGNILVKDINAGDSVSFAILENKDVYSWGCGDSVAAGWRKKDNIYKPTKVDVLRQYRNQGQSNCHVLQVSGGGVHSMMLVKRYD